MTPPAVVAAPSQGVVFRRSLFVSDDHPETGQPTHATLSALSSCGVPIDVFKYLRVMEAHRDYYQTPAEVCASVTLDTKIRLTARRVSRLLTADGTQPKVKAARAHPWYRSLVDQFPKSVAVIRIHAKCPAEQVSSNGGINLVPGSLDDPLRYFAAIGVVPDRGLRVLNTEGPAWGDKGRAWLRFDQLSKATSAKDAEVWVITREDEADR